LEFENIVTFLGKKTPQQFTGEIGNNYNIRITGRRIKHIMGKTSIKMYDKFGHILRIETTVKDVTFFNHYCEVRHKDGPASQKLAYMKKNIYSLKPLREILVSANTRYMEFISAIEDNSIGHKKLEKATQTIEVDHCNYKGFNFFDKDHKAILLTLARCEFSIYGFRSKNFKKHLAFLSPNKITRLLKNLKLHGIIKKIGKSYKYYLTRFGKEIIT
jgi:hypothetical protein